MKIELDVKPNVPTKSGRIYSEECLDKAFDKFVNGKGISYIQLGQPSSDMLIVDMKSVFGRVDVIDKKDGYYEADIKVLQKPEVFLELLKNSKAYISGRGNLKDGKVEDLVIDCLFIEPK